METRARAEEAGLEIRAGSFRVDYYYKTGWEYFRMDRVSNNKWNVQDVLISTLLIKMLYK